MEPVEGETLADRIARGSIPLHEALAMAMQIATPLDAAHERGIVHRDLEPANINVATRGDATGRGRVSRPGGPAIEATNGNLGAHLAKLVEAGYVQEEKRFEGRRPQSRYRLTKAGRSALVRHIAVLKALVDQSG